MGSPLRERVPAPVESDLPAPSRRPARRAPTAPRVAPEQLDTDQRRAVGPGLAEAGNRAATNALHGPVVQKIDTLDPFLASRISLFQVRVVGTLVLVTLPITSWAKRYTDRVLAEAGLAATLMRMYAVDPPIDRVRTEYAAARTAGQIRLNERKDDPVTERWRTEYEVYIDQSALQAMAGRLGKTPEGQTAEWRRGIGLARMMAWGVDEIGGLPLASLSMLLPPDRLGASNLTVEHIHHYFTKERQTLIELAKTHAATAAWRRAFQQQPDLVADRRPPTYTDFPAGVDRWGTVALELAIAARKTIAARVERQREKERKDNTNDWLSPREVATENAAAFVAQQFDDQARIVLQPLGWAVTGGETWTNIKGQQIFILRARDGIVVFQDLKTTRFYQQTADGFAQEQLYSIYAEAGRKSLGAIKLTKLVLAIAGDIFPVVRYGLIATEVLHVGGKLYQHEAQLKALYADFATAYRNVDTMMADLLPSLTDPEHLKLLSPLANPDAISWLRTLLRLAMLRAGKIAAGQFASDAVVGFLAKLWAVVKKGLLAIVHAGSVLFPGVSGSVGVTQDQAEAYLRQLLAQAGVAGAQKLAAQLSQMSASDRARLVREVEALHDGGTELMELVEQVVSF